MLAALISSLVFTSCKDNETVDANSFETMQTYMLDNHMDLGDIISYHPDENTAIKFVAGPPAEDALTDYLAKYHIIDIRSTTDYASGHLDGAVNIAPVEGDLSGVLTEATNAGDKPILVVCYSGQQACFTTSCLRMYGYSNAQALKWGMSGWTSEDGFDKWTSNCKNDGDGHSNWSYEAAPQNGIYEYPTITLNLTDGGEILKSRVEDVLAAGFKGVIPSEVLNDPSDYQVNNYFSEGHYTGFGHIDGALRIQPLTFADNTITSLDPDSKVVTYCYTGQTSAVITAYLRVLGYDAYSLMFGMNGLWNLNPFWSDPEIKNQWGADSKAKSLPVVQ